MFRFLHAADIHLDSPQRGLDRYEGAPVNECRGATRRALENLVDLALVEEVAFLVIVGDLYDGDWPDYNTGLFFAKQMLRLRDGGIPVFMIRGNHDAANKMTKDLKLADNVRVLSSQEVETVILEDQGVAIHGQSFPTQAVVTNLAKSYPTRRKGYFNLGLLHTCVDGREGHEPYAPCSLTDLRTREYGYWALGHIHTRETLYKNDPWIVFPGNLQGRHARESGPKGCMLVTVDDHHDVISAEPRWLDVVRWETCQLDAEGASDGDEIVSRFRDRLIQLLSTCDDRLLALRIDVRGATKAHSSLSSRAMHWISEFRQTALDVGSCRVWIEKILLRTSSQRSLTDDLLSDAPLAELATLLDELRRDEFQLNTLCTRAFADLSRKLPPDLLDGLHSSECFRGLIDQVGPLLFERLLKQ